VRSPQDMARSLYTTPLIDWNSGPGGTIKITVWLASRERETWIASAEVLGIALILLSAPGPILSLLVGLPLLTHLGYTALTSLPIGMIPGRSVVKRERRNQDLRIQVRAFLNEVRRVEEYVQRSRDLGRPRGEVEQSLHAAEKRMMAAAVKVVQATGRSTESADSEARTRGADTRPIRVFTPIGQGTVPE